MPEVIETLNDLIATCRDSEEGFGKAAKGAHNDVLRNRFMGLSTQRAGFANELSQHVRQMGGEPPAAGHVSGLQHRGWRELETSIRPKEDATFIAECELGEENTVNHYEHALTCELPDEIRAVVERQRVHIQQALLELRGLKQVRRTAS